ncbi:MAG: hypothetical protein SGCHY_003779 [Lobulomycetales sp.]
MQLHLLLALVPFTLAFSLKPLVLSALANQNSRLWQAPANGFLQPNELPSRPSDLFAALPPGQPLELSPSTPNLTPYTRSFLTSIPERNALEFEITRGNLTCLSATILPFNDAASLATLYCPHTSPRNVHGRDLLHEYEHLAARYTRVSILTDESYVSVVRVNKTPTRTVYMRLAMKNALMTGSYASYYEQHGYTHLDALPDLDGAVARAVGVTVGAVGGALPRGHVKADTARRILKRYPDHELFSRVFSRLVRRAEAEGDAESRREVEALVAGVGLEWGRHVPGFVFPGSEVICTQKIMFKTL